MSGSGIESDTKQKQVEALPLGESVKPETHQSLEIARRGFEYHVNKNKKEFYPKLLVKHQWKEMATKYTDWKEFFLAVKNLKLKYRVSLNDVKIKFNVFQQNSSHKSMVLNYVFYD